MRKSPGKWIKTVLFGKKTSRSNGSRGRDGLKTTKTEREVWIAGKGPHTDFAADSGLISQTVPASTDGNGGNSRLEKVVASGFPCDGEISLPVNEDAENQGTVEYVASNDPVKLKEEKAAIKAQSAFRGFLARRAFRALRGIIRLQALVRGQLVRRQAVSTLHSVQKIVKLQALVRGRRARLSDLGFRLKKRSREKAVDAKPLESMVVNMSTQKKRILANAFVSKLLASSTIAMPLRMQYSKADLNSAWNWLERWSSKFYWKPFPALKKTVDSKPQTKQGSSNSVEIESGRPKRSVRRHPTANVDSGSTHFTSESEKFKRNSRKILSHPVDPVQEHPQNELEKVKRSLRKVSSSTVEVPDRLDVENEKLKRSLKKVPSSPSDVQDQVIGDSLEKMKIDTAVVSAPQSDTETSSKLVASEEPVEMLPDDHPSVESPPLESSGKDGDIPMPNEELNSKEDQPSYENHKTSKRRASFPAKSENVENGIQNSPTLPSYMAPTQSAKAKLRSQGSPRLVVSDGPEKNGFTRRHSLPSAPNGKMSALSPRTQKLVQVTGKGGIRSEKSLLCSRDANEKVIQAEWRR